MKLSKSDNLQLNFPKRISYILVTKNRGDRLEEYLLSLKKLIKKQDELIIIDGNSKDATKNIIKKNSERVNFFISEEDNSPTHAFNKGILVAKGKYLKNLNDDDLIYPAAMEKAITVLENNPDIDLLICGGTKQYGNNFKIVCLDKGINYGKSVEDVFRYGASGVGFITRHSSIAKLGLYPTNIASDIRYAVNAIHSRGVVRFCRLNLYNHPVHKNSVTLARKDKYYQDFLKTMREYTSIRFYLTYLVKFKIKTFVNRFFMLPILGSLKKKSKNKELSIVWDGELS